jgi:hypothetical protein
MSTLKGSKLSRDIYKLKSVEEGLNEHMKRKQVIKGHLQTGKHRAKDKLANGKEASR